MSKSYRERPEEREGIKILSRGGRIPEICEGRPSYRKMKPEKRTKMKIKDVYEEGDTEI